MNDQPLTPYTLYIHHEAADWSPDEEEMLGDHVVALLERLKKQHGDIKQVLLADGDSYMDLWLVQACEKLAIPCVVWGQEELPLNPLLRHGSIEYVYTEADPCPDLVRTADRVLLLTLDGDFDHRLDQPIYLLANHSFKMVYWVTLNSWEIEPIVMATDLHWFGPCPTPLSKTLQYPPATLTLSASSEAQTYRLQCQNLDWHFSIPSSALAVLGPHPQWLVANDQLYSDCQTGHFVWLGFLDMNSGRGVGYVCRLVLAVDNIKTWFWLSVIGLADLDLAQGVIEESLVDYIESGDFQPCGTVQLLPAVLPDEA